MRLAALGLGLLILAALPGSPLTAQSVDSAAIAKKALPALF